MDWFNAERRFIFATKTPNLRNEWIEEIRKDMVFNGNMRVSANEIVEIVNNKSRRPK